MIASLSRRFAKGQRPAVLYCCATIVMSFATPAFAVDTDGDGVDNTLDNCPNVYNPAQLDDNGDGIGDACECLHFSGSFFSGESPGDFFGRPVAGVGDVNNDGIPDVAVVANENTAGGAGAGRVYVFSGLTRDTLFVFTGSGSGSHIGFEGVAGADVDGDGFSDLIIGEGGTNQATVFSGATGDTLWSFTNPGGFGASAASGDLNNDGFPDVVIGATSGVLGAGEVWAYSGFDGSLLWMVPGESAGDNFGSSVACADVNNDNFDDVIVGASLSDMAGTDAGRVYIVLGHSGFLSNTIDGEFAHDGFGLRVRYAGDINSDGFEDYMVSTGGPVTLGFTGAGRAYVYSGKNDSLIWKFTGSPGDASFAFALDYVGDFNGDGVGDIAIGSMASTGSVNIHSGQDSSLIYTLLGEYPGDNFASSAAFAGDINQDGLGDIIVGADNSDSSGLNSGRAYIFLGSGDADGDFVPDACDNCPGFDNALDSDSDCVADAVDNCPDTFNPLQEDLDGDGRGDSCFVPTYLSPLTVVISDATTLPPSGSARSNPPTDPQLNIRVTDPTGLVIGADSVGNITNTIGDSALYTQINGNDSVIINGPKSGEYQFEIIPEFGEDQTGRSYTVGIRTDGTVELRDGPFQNPFTGEIDTLFHQSIPFQWGDANEDRSFNIADVTFEIAYIFTGGSAPSPLMAGDANCDGSINIADVTYMISAIFSGGPLPGCG